ncbi:50S ribosomal protein L15e [Candidatus Woesearchaeota archaeon]|nr:50S ribosomal protein L15e [Candidatus Woesearchaeota archaeon]
MGIYSYIKELWKQPKKNMPELWKERLIKWRKEPVTVRIDRPTRLDRARALGYKAKQGYIMVRQRVNRGGRTREKIRHARRPKTRRHRKIVAKSYQQIAEERANRKYVNCEVLNSYWVAQDGKHYWYEVILLDKAHPSIMKDKATRWVAEPQHRGRVFRGLTSAGKKSRGLRHKGKGAEKVRPSLRANKRRAH